MMVREKGEKIWIRVRVCITDRLQIRVRVGIKVGAGKKGVRPRSMKALMQKKSEGEGMEFRSGGNVTVLDRERLTVRVGVRIKVRMGIKVIKGVIKWVIYII